MKGFIVILSGWVFVGLLQGFGGGWMGSKKSFCWMDWKPIYTDFRTTPYQYYILPEWEGSLLVSTVELEDFVTEIIVSQKKNNTPCFMYILSIVLPNPFKYMYLALLCRWHGGLICIAFCLSACLSWPPPFFQFLKFGIHWYFRFNAQVESDGFSSLANINTVGGKSLLGLGKVLTGCQSHGELMELAKKGTSVPVNVTYADVLAKPEEAKEGGHEDNAYAMMAGLNEIPVFLFGKGIGKTKGSCFLLFIE